MNKFKFLTKNYRTFHLNMMMNPFGRIPSRPIILESDDYTRSNTFEGTVGELFDRYPGVTICIVGMIITQGTVQTVINYHNADIINQRGLLFQDEDKVIIRYKMRDNTI